MSNYMILGMFAGVIFGLVIAVLVLKFTKTDGNIKCNYDERQANIRGKGFKMSFFTLMIYDALYGMLGIMTEKPFIDSLAAMIIGICLSAAIYIVYCIWSDAYFSLNENPRRLFFVFGIIALFNLVLGSFHIIKGSVITDGMLNFRITNFICGILFIVIFVALLAKKMSNASEVE